MTQVEYPTHAILPDSAEGLFAERQLPWQPIPVGNGWVHAPLVYREGVKYRAESAGPAPKLKFESMPGQTLEFGRAHYTLGSFLNGQIITPDGLTTEEDGPYRRAMKLVGGGCTLRWSEIAGCPAVRITHNIKIPSSPVVDMGFQLNGKFGEVLSNLGNARQAYNRDARGQWTGWLATGGVLLSIRHAREKFPRGFQVTDNSIRLFQHFENGERVRPGDVSPERIAHLPYLHQGKLDLHLPPEYFEALKDDPRLEDLNRERTPEGVRDYPSEGVSSTLDILLVFFDASSRWQVRDLVAWHEMHQRGPIVSLVTVPGMKGTDFPVVEKHIKDCLTSYPEEFRGQFLYGDFRQVDDSLWRVRYNNHYWTASTLFGELLRTRDPDILHAARKFFGYFRDLVCYYPGAFAHGKGLLPWMESSSYGHWIDPTGLKLGWQVLGDRDALDKYDAWAKSVKWSPTTPNRESQTVLVHGRQLMDYLGQDYSALEPLREALEALPLQPGSIRAPGWWHPLWPTKEYALRQQPFILGNGVASLYVSLLDGKIERHFGWLSRLAVDHPRPQKPGQIGDCQLPMQWGLFLDELRRREIAQFPFCTEPGDYPVKLSNSGVNSRDVGCEVVFEKTAEPLSFSVVGHAFAESMHALRVNLLRPDGALEVLTDPPLIEANTTRVERQSGRAGFERRLTITGPAGEYRLQFASYEIGLYGNITGGPEYCIVAQGAWGQQSEGWFMDPKGHVVKIPGPHDPRTPDRVFGKSPAKGVFTWPAGYFATKREWLPAVAAASPPQRR